MKIGLITPGGFDRSGTERVTPAFLWLVERLARWHEVHVYTLYQYPQAEEYPLLGATVHNLGYSGRRGPGARNLAHGLRALGREHRRGRFDALHGLWATESGLLAALAGRVLRVPAVVTAMCAELIALPEIDYGAQLSRKSRILVRTTLSLATTVTSESEYARRLLRRYRPDAHLIPFGVDCVRFAPPVAAPCGPPWRLLHVASLNRVKDQQTLLRAFARIHRAEPAARLDIVGEDTLNGEIQRLAHDILPVHAVRFHGFEPSEHVARRMRTSHLLLHSSRSEAAPVVFLEAAACGLPTVGTAVGLIDDAAPEAAVAVPVGDDATMANAALALLHNEDYRRDLGRRALVYARERDADATAERFEMLYRHSQTAQTTAGGQSTR
jgi:glycosyltransferase involved in cell wall biosynthesis